MYLTKFSVFCFSRFSVLTIISRHISTHTKGHFVRATAICLQVGLEGRCTGSSVCGSKDSVLTDFRVTHAYDTRM